MTAIKRLAAVYMLLVSVAVWANWLGSQFYDPTLEGAAIDAWRILDPLMVVGMAMALIVALSRKLGHDSEIDGSVTREYLESNFTFYYSAAILLALLWNWFGFQWVDPPNDVPLVWTLIDITVPLVMASTGIRLLRED